MDYRMLALQIEDSSGNRQLPLLQPVCRVGAAADNEIRLDGTAHVALVLFQQEQGLFVLNRTGAALHCGKLSIPAEQRVLWPLLQPLQLGAAVLRPVRVSERTAPLPSEPAGGTSPATVRKPGTSGSLRPQLMVILACALLAVPIIATLLSSDTSETTSVQMRLCLQELGMALEQAQQPIVKNRLHTLAQLLQRCRMATANGLTAEHPDRRDALAYCQSLAGAELDAVTDFERHLTQRLAFLLAEGG
jgi:hypothetical protein